MSVLKLGGIAVYCIFRVVKMFLSSYLNLLPKLIFPGVEASQFQNCDPAAREADQSVGIHRISCIGGHII